jgi:hypothetical protein
MFRDAMRMVADIYRTVGSIDVRASNPKMLHDRLIEDAVKIEHNDDIKEIEYDEKLHCIHGASFKSGDYEFKLCLPHTPKDIRVWARQLRNCMAGYINSVVCGNTTLVAIIATKYKGQQYDKLYGALEYRDGRIIQMSCFANSAVPGPIRTSIVSTFMSIGLITSDEVKNIQQRARRQQDNNEIVFDADYRARQVNNYYNDRPRVIRDQDHQNQLWLPGIVCKTPEIREGFRDRQRFGGNDGVMEEERRRIQRANGDNEVFHPPF